MIQKVFRMQKYAKEKRNKKVNAKAKKKPSFGIRAQKC